MAARGKGPASQTAREVDRYIGNRFRVLLEMKGMRAIDMARGLECSKNTITRYQNGEHSMSPSVLLNAAKLLGVPVRAFFEGLDDASDEVLHQLPTLNVYTMYILMAVDQFSFNQQRQLAAFLNTLVVEDMPELPPGEAGDGD